MNERRYWAEFLFVEDSMISTGMMIALAIIYAAIVLAAIMERNWPRALYFVGAILITVSILWMGDQHGNAI